MEVSHSSLNNLLLKAALRTLHTIFPKALSFSYNLGFCLCYGISIRLIGQFSIDMALHLLQLKYVQCLFPRHRLVAAGIRTLDMSRVRRTLYQIHQWGPSSTKIPMYKTFSIIFPFFILCFFSVVSS